MLLRTDRAAKTLPKTALQARVMGAVLTPIWAPILALALTPVWAPGLALAQSASYFDRNHNIGVLDRSRPDYQPLGVRLGLFTLSPSLNITPQYDSNIFAFASNVQSDFITTVQPALAINGAWPRANLGLNLESGSNFYAQHSDQNTTNYSVSAAGQMDVLAASQLNGGLSFNHTTEARTDEGAIVTRTPVQYDTTSASLGATWTLTRLRLTQQALFQHNDYSSSVSTSSTSTSSAQRDLSYLNGDFYSFTLRADYALTPEIAAYLSGQYNRREYPTVVSAIADRTSGGYDITAGSSFDITRLIRGQIGFGYLSQTYASTLYKPVNGPSVHINLDYFISELTTLGLDVNRAVIDAEDPTAVSYVQTHGALRAAHELLRNLILSSSIGYESDAFTGYDRTDRRFNASLSGSYLINRDLSLSAGYTYLDETSSGLARIHGYDVSIISLGLNLHL